MLARRKIGTGAAIATGVILAAVLTGSASAGTSTPGCNGDENAGAHGVKCIDKVTGVLGTLPVQIGTPSCPDATASLVQARVIVGGLNGKGGTSAKLTEAQEASNKAHAKVNKAIKDDNAEDAKDAAVATAKANLKTATDADTAEDTTKVGNPPVSPIEPAAPGDSQDQAVTSAQNALTVAQNADTEASNGGSAEDPGDTEDAVVAVAKSGAFDADQRLHKAQIAEGTAEQAIVDAEVVIGQACKTPPPPAPPTADSPAPQPSVITGGNPGPITIINGQAPAPQIVAGNLPVTG